MTSIVKFGFQTGVSELFLHKYMQENQLCKKNSFAQKSVSNGWSYCWDRKRFTAVSFGVRRKTTGAVFRYSGKFHCRKLFELSW